ncbi:hypothetical protein ACFWXO_43320 [Kitasatospora sp. NPDC059088]|uniref:GP88 family protein n=1 Tax=Kitasatospora sp. NPDC059088 TaxID=3346722 RepID=UPI0036846BAC
MPSRTSDPGPGLFDAPPTKLRKNLLTDNNGDLNRGGRKTYLWTTPALEATLPSGRKVVTCPEAGVCAAGIAAHAVSHSGRVSLGHIA